MKEVTITPEADLRAMRIVSHAIRELGGSAEVVRRHEQAMLPALVESAYILVLTNEGRYSAEEVARFLGTSVGAVASVIGAPTEMAVTRFRELADPHAEFAWHEDPDWSGTPSFSRMESEIVAGALTKLAYGMVIREGIH